MTKQKVALQMWPPSRCIPYARNARVIPESAVGKVAASIKEFGFKQPIVVDAEGVIVAGHTRLLAAERLGLETVPVLVADDLTPAQVKAYRLADNRTGQEATWDMELLGIELEDLAGLDIDLSLTGFDAQELLDLKGDEGREIVEDEVPDLPTEPVTKMGDLYAMGKHHLLCGDSTKAEDVSRLLADHKPGMMVTDPPYGVEYDPTWRVTAEGPDGRLLSKGTHRQGEVTNDDVADWHGAWALFPGDVAYVWHSGLHGTIVVGGLMACGFEQRAQIIWMKQSIVIGRGHYHWRHEPCAYMVKRGKTSGWVGDRKQSTIWEISNAAGNGEGDDAQTDHSAQKPVECMGRPMRNHGFLEVYDPFCGSGTSVVAAEQLERTCYAMELDPGYCDVIVKRWENLTGKKATLVP